MALMKANLLGLLFLPLLGHMAWLGAAIIGIAVLLVYLIARYWGSLLPCLAELGIAADDQAGMHTAILYLANILGAAAGSVLTGFVLMNHLGLVSIAMTLTVTGFICTVMLLCTLRGPRSEKIIRASIASALCLLAVIVVPRWSANVLESLQWKGQLNAPHLAELVENRSGIIAVTEDGTVFGNGMYDGQFNTNLKRDTNGIVRPYALSLFHPAPREVLVIGLASGSWSQVIANNSEVASVTVVEINSGYKTLIAKEPEVASLLTNPKVTLVTDDGRRWLRANPNRRFDAIVANATYHFRANATNLLSTEFLNLIKGHLNAGGIFFYNTTGSDRVQRTGCLAFAHGARFINHLAGLRYADPLGLCSLAAHTRILHDRWPAGIRPDSQRRPCRAWDRLTSWEASLAPSAEGHAEGPIEPCSDILARTIGKQSVTDDNMGTEWRYFLKLE
jgi:spermidine synthase